MLACMWHVFSNWENAYLENLVSHFSFVKYFLKKHLLLNCTAQIWNVDKYIWTNEYILREDTVDSAFEYKVNILPSP